MMPWQPVIIMVVEALALIGLVKLAGWTLHGALIAIVTIGLILPLAAAGGISLWLKRDERQALWSVIVSTATNNLRAIWQVLTFRK